MSKVIEDIKLIDFLPQYLKENKDIYGLCQGIESELKALIVNIHKLNLQKRLATGDITEIEAEDLMWENHVDYFDTELTLEKKVELIKKSTSSHMKKGTKASVEEQLELVLKDYELLEWFDIDGLPYTFKINVGNKLPTPEVVDQVYKVINKNKNVRSHWVGFVAGDTLTENTTTYKTKEILSNVWKEEYGFSEKSSFDNILFSFIGLDRLQDMYEHENIHIDKLEELESDTLSTNVHAYKAGQSMLDSGREEHNTLDKISFNKVFYSFMEVDNRHDIYKYEEE